jgi:hypothetical protein
MELLNSSYTEFDMELLNSIWKPAIFSINI